MSFGLIFWILMLLWLLSILGSRFGWAIAQIGIVSDILLWVLLALLGWHVFGAMVHA